MERMNYSPLIYAYAQENIAVTGEGTLHGQARDRRWPWKTAERFFGSSRPEPDRPVFPWRRPVFPWSSAVFGDGSRLRPPFIQPYRLRERAHRRRALAQLALLEHPSGAVQERLAARRRVFATVPTMMAFYPESVDH